jgi:hypothetical protein
MGCFQFKQPTTIPLTLQAYIPEIPSDIVKLIYTYILECFCNANQIGSLKNHHIEWCQKCSALICFSWKNINYPCGHHIGPECFRCGAYDILTVCPRYQLPCCQRCLLDKELVRSYPSFLLFPRK